MKQINWVIYTFTLSYLLFPFRNWFVSTVDSAGDDGMVGGGGNGAAADGRDVIIGIVAAQLCTDRRVFVRDIVLGRTHKDTLDTAQTATN